MKVIGAIFIFCATCLFGFDLSHRVKERVELTKHLLLSLQMIEAEMRYSQLPLQQIFQHVSEKTISPLGRFYHYLATKLKEHQPYFTDVWDEAVERLVRETPLTKNVQILLQQFGRNLGQHSFIEQEKHIKLVMYHLEAELNEAQEQKRKYETMFRTLGILVGLFIIIVLY